MSTLVDPSAIEIYCQVVFASLDGFVPLRSLKEKDGPNASPAFEWCRPDVVSGRLIRFARSAEVERRACYAIPGVVGTYRKAGKDDVTGFATICVDYDGEAIGESVNCATAVLGPPTLIVKSGGFNSSGEPKLHIYWRLGNGHDETVRIVNLRALLAAKTGGDPSFARASQPIRVAGSVYGKSGVRRAVEIERHEQGRQLSIGEAALVIERMEAMRGTDNVKLSDVVARQKRRYPMSFEEQLEIPLILQGGASGITRFDAITRFIGVWVKAVATEEVTEEFGIEKCLSYARNRIEGNDWTEGDVRRGWRAIMELEMRKEGHWS